MTAPAQHGQSGVRNGRGFILLRHGGSRKTRVHNAKAVSTVGKTENFAEDDKLIDR